MPCKLQNAMRIYLLPCHTADAIASMILISLGSPGPESQVEGTQHNKLRFMVNPR